MATLRRRLDAELVRRGLAESRHGARQRIEAGDVLVGGATADKPARLVSAAEPIELQGPPPRYVGRGGLKLEAALAAFGIDVTGRRAIDVGASTGGFTDCLLQHGAASVVALDVGHGQLHERLRADSRVVVIERCNARDLGPDRCSDAEREALVGPAAPVVVADLSFISLRLVAGSLAALVEEGGSVIVLVKPQFEAGHDEVSPGRGVVRDPAVWARVLSEVPVFVRGGGGYVVEPAVVRVQLEGPAAVLRQIRDRDVVAQVWLPDAAARPSYTAVFGATEGVRAEVA